MVRRKSPVPTVETGGSSHWKHALRGDKLFIYWKNELMPRFTFDKKGGNYWKGHGITAQSIRKALEFVSRQPEPK